MSAASVDLSDGQLVARARAGDEVAFDQLFRRHYERTVNLAYRLQGSLDDAEDIAQTAFIRLHHNLARIRDGQALEAWLYRAVVNLVRDRHKSAMRKPWSLFSVLQSRTSSEEELDAPEWGDGGPTDPARQVERQHLEEALEAAITQLPLEFREPLVLHHMEGLDVATMASVLGLPEGTVKSRLSRARDRLRRTLMPWFEDQDDKGNGGTRRPK